MTFHRFRENGAPVEPDDHGVAQRSPLGILPKKPARFIWVERSHRKHDDMGARIVAGDYLRIGCSGAPVVDPHAYFVRASKLNKNLISRTPLPAARDRLRESGYTRIENDFKPYSTGLGGPWSFFSIDLRTPLQFLGEEAGDPH